MRDNPVFAKVRVMFRRSRILLGLFLAKLRVFKNLLILLF